MVLPVGKQIITKGGTLMERMTWELVDLQWPCLICSGLGLQWFGAESGFPARD